MGGRSKNNILRMYCPLWMLSLIYEPRFIHFSDPNYWAAGYYGNYPYGQDPAQYFAAAAAAYGAWGGEGGWPPAFQPPPPSQPPPPPPPEDDVPPPPPGVPNDSAQPTPKRSKTALDHTESLPPDLPPPPGPMPAALAKPGAKPSADKDKCGYYDSSTDATTWDSSAVWGAGGTVTRTFAQVVSGNKPEPQSNDRAGKILFPACWWQRHCATITNFLL